jgi:hypothetical protein
VSAPGEYARPAGPRWHRNPLVHDPLSARRPVAGARSW